MLKYGTYFIISEILDFTLSALLEWDCKDLLAKMREEETADGYLLLTSAMLKSADEPIFLDDITVSQVEEQLGVSVVVVPETDGRQLLAEILGL